MKKQISSALLISTIFMGCVKNEPIPQEAKKVDLYKSQVLAQLTPKTKFPTPYIQESKFIKILILPFENEENDIDYGGIIETKLEGSRFIFDDNVKNKIIEDTTLIGEI